MKFEEENFDRLHRIGEKIKALRVKAGYTSYEKFAVEHELNRGYYWDVENGRNITLIYLLKILSIHKISPKDFFSDID